MFKKCQNYKQNQKTAEKKKQARTSNQSNTKRKSIGKTSRKSLPTEDEAQEHLKFLKTVVVNEKNIKAIESKLKITAAKRVQLLKNKQFDFLENFPCLFTHPPLVSTMHNVNVKTKFKL